MCSNFEKPLKGTPSSDLLESSLISVLSSRDADSFNEIISGVSKFSGIYYIFLKFNVQNWYTVQSGELKEYGEIMFIFFYFFSYYSNEKFQVSERDFQLYFCKNQWNIFVRANESSDCLNLVDIIGEIRWKLNFEIINNMSKRSTDDHL